MEFKIKSKTHGEFIVLIDDEDYDKIKNFKWGIKLNKFPDRFYVISHDYTEGNKIIHLHRQIMNCPDNFVVDHINHNVLDNRKSNLRICTLSENSKNRKLSKNSSSGFKGVCWDKNSKKWKAYISMDLKPIYIGLFDEKILAAIAYNDAALKYHGEFSCLNKIN